MRPVTRWILILIAGIVLLVAPLLLRTAQSAWNQPTYQPPVIATAAIAVTPIPTPSPVAIATPMAPPENRIRRAPVVVDLAHYSEIDRDRFQPLATALSAQGIDLDFWLPTVDIASFRKITDFPDLSKELAQKLNDASALVVISPLFLYTPAEVAIVEKFVADGGRLLLISDPDIESDAAADTNQLATAFNIVFNEDYLYDTVDNDENYTYFFQGDFLNDAAALQDSRIAFYGGRSISGAMMPQVRSAATTLSSLRNGQTSFNTVAIGGQPANGSTGRVLAMSDFDVLTEPFVSRHDNRAILGFVSDFLAGAMREDTITDFPGFLGEEVALVLDNTEPFGASAVAKTAELQRFVEESGRTLYLAPSSILSNTTPAESTAMTASLVYVAGYRAAEASTSILSDLGFTLVEEVVTPTLSAPAVAAAAVTPAPVVTNTTTATATVASSAPSQPSPAATPQPVAASTMVTPVTTLYLARGTACGSSLRRLNSLPSGPSHRPPRRWRSLPAVSQRLMPASTGCLSMTTPAASSSAI
ncbi:MAG: hypothetical protein IPK16_18065 [Anaerolineales bacterium]|nr:hypothetical protein [Anaerolineales bacterium]